MALHAPPPLPKEHGAWTMLAIPMVFGLAGGGVACLAAWMIVSATILVFLAHYAIVPWIQRTRERKASPAGYAMRRLSWGASYLAGGALCFALAIVMTQGPGRSGVLAIAAVSALLAAIYAASASFGSGRTLVAEILGMIGMTLTAPLMTAASGRPLVAAAFGPSAMALAYFLSSVAFVRTYEGTKQNSTRATALCVFAHIGIAEGIGAAAFFGILPRFWWIAFVPVAARTVWGLVSPPANLRALGMREIWVALSFTAIAAATL